MLSGLSYDSHVVLFARRQLPLDIVVHTEDGRTVERCTPTVHVQVINRHRYAATHQQEQAEMRWNSPLNGCNWNTLATTLPPSLNLSPLPCVLAMASSSFSSCTWAASDCSMHGKQAIKTNSPVAGGRTVPTNTCTGYFQHRPWRRLQSASRAIWHHYYKESQVIDS